MAGLWDFLMGRGGQTPMGLPGMAGYPGTPGYNPDAPMPGPAVQTGMAGQGAEPGGFTSRINDAYNSPLFHVGLGLLGTGQFGPGIATGLASYGQQRNSNERRGLLQLQQQQLAGTMQDQQRKRQQAAQLRASLPPNSPLANLPDEQLLTAASTLATRETPEEIAAKARLQRETPEEAAAKARALLPIEKEKAGFNDTPLAIPDDKSPTGFRYVPRSQAIGQPALGPQGLALEFGPDGRPTGIRMGAGVTGKGADGSGLAKPTINALEEQAMAAGNALARLDQVQRGYKPEYLQLGTKIGNSWSAVREKMGANLPEGDRQALTEFSQFRRDSIGVVNQTIKDITGAAMSVPEAQRISRQVPDPGTGIFDGDSPTEFQAKLDGVMKDTKNALLRANWARAKGLDPLKTGVELSEVPALINKRGNEIAAQVKQANPQADEQAIRQLVRQQLGREFGLLQ
jgi:hypothetical protein